MTDPRWEALRKAAQDVVRDSRAHRDRLAEWIRCGQLPTGYAAGMSGPVAALGAALAALEELAPMEDAGDVACYHHGMGQLSGLTTAAEMADKWAAQYPTDVFLPDGTSIEARAAHHARRVAGFIAKDIRDLIAECSEPAPPEAPDRGVMVDADALVVPPFYTEKPLSIHAKCGAEVAALRAERDADRDAFLSDIGRRARVYGAIEEGLLAAIRNMEAALATERARALEVEGAMRALIHSAKGTDCVGYEEAWERLRSAIKTAERALSASPPPAPAPQGEERCHECGDEPHDIGDGWSGCACGALWRRDRTGRAPRAEEGA